MFCTFMKNIHYPKNIQFENKFILYIFHHILHAIVYIIENIRGVILQPLMSFNKQTVYFVNTLFSLYIQKPHYQYLY